MNESVVDSVSRWCVEQQIHGWTAVSMADWGVGSCYGWLSTNYWVCIDQGSISLTGLSLAAITLY